MKINNLKIFTDFDGTITQIDSLNMVLDKFANQPWRPIEDRVTQKTLSEKQALQMEFDLVYASLAEVKNFLKNNAKIDPSFIPFAEWCQQEEIPLIVLSGGFDIFIKTIFDKFSINHGIEIFSNSVKVNNKKWQVISSGLPKINNLCNHCKTNHLLQARQAGRTVVYIGDGNTDRCPAEHADIVFAKEELAAYLIEKKLNFVKFTSFEDIENWIK